MIHFCDVICLTGYTQYVVDDVFFWFCSAWIRGNACTSVGPWLIIILAIYWQIGKIEKKYRKKKKDSHKKWTVMFQPIFVLKITLMHYRFRYTCKCHSNFSLSTKKASSLSRRLSFGNCFLSHFAPHFEPNEYDEKTNDSSFEFRMIFVNYFQFMFFERGFTLIVQHASQDVYLPYFHMFYECTDLTEATTMVINAQ